jgi:hypothetical protein
MSYVHYISNTIKVYFSLYFIKHEDLKTCGGMEVRVMTPSSLYFGTR